EKEAQFEEILVRERIKDMGVHDRAGTEWKLTEARWHRFSRALTEFEGWLSRLGADFGPGPADFAVTHRLVETAASGVSDVNEALDLAKEGMQVSRFKGLGEMDAVDLEKTTMDPATRMLIRVEVEDAAAADLIFSMLMGDQVEPRRDFIEQNAKDVRFLDV